MLLHVRHNLLQAQFPEIPFSLHSTLATVRDRVAAMTGSQASTMDLYLDQRPISVGGENLDKMLGFFSPAANAVLYVVDNNPFSLARNGALEVRARVVSCFFGNTLGGCVFWTDHGIHLSFSTCVQSRCLHRM